MCGNRKAHSNAHGHSNSHGEGEGEGHGHDLGDGVPDLNKYDGHVPGGSCCASDSDDNESEGGCKDACCGGPKREINIELVEAPADDTVCLCCIKVLVDHPDAVGLSLQESIQNGLFSSAASRIPSPSKSVANTAVEGVKRTLRRCCQLLESMCARDLCCYISVDEPRRKKPRTSGLVLADSGRPQPGSGKEEFKAEATLADEKKAAGLEVLQLEISGLDCADCGGKVDKALRRLPSVKPLGLDYLSGIANLQYDPEVISPEAISRYVARSTGFGVQPVDKQGGQSTNNLTLPISFARVPPSHALESFNARHRNELGGFAEITFPVQGDKARQPRDVLKELEQYGPSLMATAALEGAEDRVSQDLIRIAIRTTVAITLSIPVLVFAWGDLPGRPVTYGAVSVALTTLIQIVGFPIVSASARSVIYLREADMGVLVAVSTLTAYIFSLVAYAFEVAGLPFTKPFFETPALLISLIYVGRLVQAATRRSASSAVKGLQDLQSSEVIMLEKDGKTSVEKPLDVRLLHYGDVLRIKPDSRVPTDGMVVGGTSEVDESSATGESLPLPKYAGTTVTAGTLNLSGTIDVQVTQLVHENSLSRVADLVKQAQATKSRFQDVADRVSAYILPIAATAAVISLIVWICVNKYVRHWSTRDSGVSAIKYALSIMIVSCPCAIGLAVPLVVSSAMRSGLREGVLFRNSEALQTANSVDVVAFDKTGTLSQGMFSLSRSEILVKGVERLVADLTSSNGHPISKAILAHVESFKRASKTNNGIVSIPGKGIKTVVAGFPLLGGSPRFTGVADLPQVKELLSQGLTLFTVTLGGELIATYGLADIPRPESAALVADLVARKKRVVILSGDNVGAVERFARSINVPVEDVRAACSPADKASFIADLQKEGHRVAMIGDGTNDSPSLAQADLSLSIGSGSDVAVAASSAVILGTADLRRSVVGALDLALHSRQHIILGLAWCLVYFLFAILLASGSFVKWSIEPQWAGLGELVSVMPVVIIGLGLDARWKVLARLRKY